MIADNAACPISGGNYEKNCSSRIREKAGKTFANVTADDLKILNFDYGLTDLSRFTIENCMKNRDSFSGSSLLDVQHQIKNAK